MIRLRLESPEGDVYRTFRSRTVVIGRSRQCDLSLPAAKGLSRFHCRLSLSHGTCHFEDLGSRNRSLVNGRPVVSGSVVEGDLITLGSLVVRVEAIRDGEPTEELVHPCLHCGHLFSVGALLCPRCQTAARPRRRSRQIHEHTFGGYRLVRKIGSGGMGIVFEAHDLQEDRRVALKVLRPHLARNLAYLARFIEEIRLLTSLRHPAIVQVFGRGKEGDLHYLTMELVQGQSARDALRTQGRLPWKEAVRIAWQAARALNAAHQQAGVVHGDVKPGNFLLDGAGHVKLCDFGLAQVDLQQRSPPSGGREDERRGTAAYAAPERFSEGSKPTVAGDIYGLGVSLFQLATGSLPFPGVSVAALRSQHLKAPVPSVTALAPGINPGLQILLENMMAKRAEARPADYPQLIADISLLLD